MADHRTDVFVCIDGRAVDGKIFDGRVIDCAKKAAESMSVCNRETCDGFAVAIEGAAEVGVIHIARLTGFVGYRHA